MKHRFVRLIIAFVLTALSVAFIAYIRFRSGGPHPAELSGLSAERPEPPKNDYGVPAQQQRVRDAIETAGALDYDALCRSLNIYDAAYESAQSASVSHSSPTPPVMYKQVIADRRVAKIYGFLRERPPSDASGETAKLFDAKLEQLSRAWQRAAQHENGLADATHVHAVASALFLCAVFCDGKTAREKADAWIRWFSEFEPRTQEVETYARPPWLFIVNCYMNVLERNGQSREALNQRLARLGDELQSEMPQLSVGHIYKWDALMLPSDFAHMHIGAPVDEEARLHAVSVFREHPIARVTFRVELQEKVLENVSEWMIE